MQATGPAGGYDLTRVGRALNDTKANERQLPFHCALLGKLRSVNPRLDVSSNPYRVNGSRRLPANRNI